MSSPFWVWIAAAAIFGCSAYFAIQLAGLVYGNVAPLEDGPAPTEVRTIVPIGCAALFGALFAARGADVPALAVADVVIFALSAAIWTDMTRGIIGDWFTIPPVVLIVAISVVRGHVVPVAISIALVTLPFALAAFFSKGMGFGWGDVKLVALGAALLDPQTSILVYALCCFVACAVTFVRRRRNEPIAFAPYLATAIAVGLLLPVTHSAGA